MTTRRYTGAGGSIAEALKAGDNPPEQFWSALKELCSKAKAQGKMLLVDAEEQVFQPTIDRWTVDLMRTFNRKEASVLNTYQAYLKSTPQVLREHLSLAGKEGWTVRQAIKIMEYPKSMLTVLFDLLAGSQTSSRSLYFDRGAESHS
jgi:proline dehydrogenase